ncbi:hypothetical protein LDE03_00210 [Lactobacillus delbrueckii subsp. delbrueckii]|nr:hypothetical protein LDE01_03920 [Lactobacillus delbrueckii subsp. delbrueckii]GEA74213.1 hypothetical protein LDE03_00210 [Lactobacillus delbrueckii subsp. delbrueckii]
MFKREGTFLVQSFALSSKIGQNWTKKRASWTKGTTVTSTTLDRGWRFATN